MACPWLRPRRVYKGHYLLYIWAETRNRNTALRKYIIGRVQKHRDNNDLLDGKLTKWKQDGSIKNHKRSWAYLPCRLPWRIRLAFMHINIRLDTQRESFNYRHVVALQLSGEEWIVGLWRQVDFSLSANISIYFCGQIKYFSAMIVPNNYTISTILVKPFNI